MKCNLSADEQETVIAWSNAIGSKAEIQSMDKSLTRKLLGLAESHPEDVRVIRHEEDIDMYVFDVPKKWVKVSPPVKLNLTESQIEMRKARMNEINKKKSEETV